MAPLDQLSAVPVGISALEQFLATPRIYEPFYGGDSAANRNRAVFGEHDYLFTQLEQSGLAAGSDGLPVRSCM